MGWLAKLSQKERRLLYIAVFVVSLFLIDRFIFRTALVKISEINEEIERMEEERKSYLHYLDNEKTIVKNHTDYTNNVELNSSNINETKLQMIVDEIAKANNIRMENIAPYSSRRDNQGKTAVQLSCFGKRIDIIKFLYDISTTNTPLRNEKTSLSFLPDKNEEEGFFEATIILSVVSLGLKEE